MAGEMLRTKLYYNLLRLVLLIVLLPISNHMSAMQAMSMDAAMMSQMVSSQAKAPQDNAGDNSTETCCDFIATFAVSCIFLIPQCAYIGLSGGSERVGMSIPLNRSIYIKTLSPPPKA